ncbi:uncharacterized protein BDV17DRAFT_288409 [Aspergillus undulatus]|uniref:uncharacterized protein n=1 Tax=Aspergillus undulatus TaxID=1810928 RepID=UPI003CCE37F2
MTAIYYTPAEHYQTIIAAATTAALAACNAVSQAATAATRYANALACQKGTSFCTLDEYARFLAMEECAAGALLPAQEAAQAMENVQRAAEIAAEAFAEGGTSNCGGIVGSGEEWADAVEFLRMSQRASPQMYAQYGSNDFDGRVVVAAKPPYHTDETAWADVDEFLNIAAHEQFVVMDSASSGESNESESGSDSSAAQSELESEWTALTDSIELADAVAHSEHICAQLQPSHQSETTTRTPHPMPLVSLQPDKKIGDWTGGFLVKQDKGRSVHSAFGEVTEILPFKTLIMVEETPEYQLSKFVQIPYESLLDMAEFEYSKPVELGEYAMGLLKVDGPGDKLMYGMGRVIGVKHDASLYLVRNGFEDMGVDICDEIED